MLVNVERSTGGGPGARGQGRGSGEVKCSSLVMNNMWVADLRRQGETLNHRTIDGSVLLYSRSLIDIDMNMNRIRHCTAISGPAGRRSGQVESLGLHLPPCYNPPPR